MKNILCTNIIISKSGEKRECGRFLASVSDKLNDAMTQDVDMSIVMRCPSCDKSSGWHKYSGLDGHTLEIIDGGVYAPVVECNTVRSEQMG